MFSIFPRISGCPGNNRTFATWPRCSENFSIFNKVFRIFAPPSRRSRYFLISTRVSGHVPPTQGPLESSSCSPGFVGPLVFFQRPLDLSIATQSTDATSPGTQGTLAPLLSLPSKVRTCQPAQEMLGTLAPSPGAVAISPSAIVAPGPLPVAREPVSLSLSSQETPSNLPHIHGVLDLSQYGSGSPLNVMPLTQWQQGTPSSSEGSVAFLSSVQVAVGQSLSVQQTPVLSTPTQRTLPHFLSGRGDMAPSSPSKGSKGSLLSVDVDMGTYSHPQRSPGHFKNVSGFPRSILPGPYPVGISLLALATDSWYLPHLAKGLKCLCYPPRMVEKTCLLHQILRNLIHLLHRP